jgi:hypothetical protein
MLEPRRLTALWASTACYMNNFAFFFFTIIIRYRVPLYKLSNTEQRRISLLHGIWRLLGPVSTASAMKDLHPPLPVQEQCILLDTRENTLDGGFAHCKPYTYMELQTTEKLEHKSIAIQPLYSTQAVEDHTHLRRRDQPSIFQSNSAVPSTNLGNASNCLAVPLNQRKWTTDASCSISCCL